MEYNKSYFGSSGRGKIDRNYYEKESRESEEKKDYLLKTLRK